MQRHDIDDFDTIHEDATAAEAEEEAARHREQATRRREEEAYRRREEAARQKEAGYNEDEDANDEPEEPSSSTSSKGTSRRGIKANIVDALEAALRNARTHVPNETALLCLAQDLNDEELNGLIRKFCSAISSDSSTSGLRYGNAADIWNQIKIHLNTIR